MLLCFVTVISSVPNACASVAEAEAKDRITLYIESAEDLIAFAAAVNGGDDFKGRYVVQSADIDLEGVPFTPIGIFGSGNYFYGVYDGAGHTVSNLVINSSEGKKNNGLFAQLGGTVMNLGIESGEISGACCGSFASHAASSSACIVNCYSKAKVSSSRAGGIVDNFIGTVINCWYDNDETVLPVCGYTANSLIHCYTNGAVYGKSFSGFEDRCSSTEGISLDAGFCNEMNNYLGRVYYHIDLSEDYRLLKFVCDSNGNVRFGDETVTKPGVFSREFLAVNLHLLIFGAVAFAAVCGIVVFFIYNRRRAA